jgi:hypothetical protein
VPAPALARARVAGIERAAEQRFARLVARAWIGAKHPTAARLLKHAEEQYEVHFQLRCSHAKVGSSTRIDRV